MCMVLYLFKILLQLVHAMCSIVIILRRSLKFDVLGHLNITMMYHYLFYENPTIHEQFVPKNHLVIHS